ncbi:serine hydrolase [Sphingobium yanoikuyae]|uniref:Serine hydrolase n=2 Tax=Sphingobium yanoikuyae TaxID=13690 RepID=A0A291N758_SPHYA|nr:serine hydrolase [Sphingobium yanoikuyae]
MAMLAVLAPGVHARSGASVAPVLMQWDRDEHPDLRGVLVMQKGKVVAERYFNGEAADDLHDVRSAGKSITAIMMGIAIDRGLVRRLSDPVSDYWPEAKGTPAGEVKIEDLLTMRSGLDAYDADPTSPGQEDKLDEASDPQAFMLALPRAVEPGTAYRYNSVTSAIAGVVIARASGMTMSQFAGQHLFAPIGISRWSWASDVGGYTKGQGNLSLRLRDFAAIGEMVRSGGRFHKRRIVSQSWIRAALTPVVGIGEIDPYADGYGFFWYSKVLRIAERSIPVSFASGNGGNKLYIVPSLDLVVAITSSAYGKGYGQRRSEQILRAILAELVS